MRILYASTSYVPLATGERAARRLTHRVRLAWRPTRVLGISITLLGGLPEPLHTFGAACGGDDFDWALYDYCEQHGLAGVQGGVDGEFLTICKRTKEQLSSTSNAAVRRLVDGKPRAIEISRPIFESLIFDRVERSMRQVSALLQQANKMNCTVDTVVLIGGAARTPLVIAELGRIMRACGLQAEPLRFDKQDVAVALGASYASLSKTVQPAVEPASIIDGLSTLLRSRDNQTIPHPIGRANRNDIIDGLDRLI